MNWRNTAIEELRSYSKICEAEKSLRERLEALEARLTSTRGASLSAVPVHGGGSHYEDMLLDTIAERDAVTGELAYTVKKRKLIERGLAVLADDEREVVDRFYINRTPDYIDALCDSLILCARRSARCIASRTVRYIITRSRFMAQVI